MSFSDSMATFNDCMCQLGCYIYNQILVTFVVAHSNYVVLIVFTNTNVEKKIFAAMFILLTYIYIYNILCAVVTVFCGCFLLSAMHNICQC